MDVDPVWIKNYNEVLALHKMLMDRKFDGPEDEYFGSPFIAAIQNRLADALEGADSGSGWRDWRSAAGHATRVAKVRRHLTTTGGAWANLSRQAREAYVLNCLAPLRPSDELLNELVGKGWEHGDMGELPVDPRIREVAEEFLRGDLSVVDFMKAFLRAMNKVIEQRPLHGREVDLFFTLEEWESSGWADRANAVDDLRLLSRRIVNGG